LVKVEAQQKVVSGSPTLEKATQSESNLHAEKLDWVQQIYPNPASHEFSLQMKFKLEKPMQMQVLGMGGSVNKVIQITETGKQVYTFNCSDWPNGTYILLLQTEGKHVGIAKVAVQH
jgi:hypothetical protein